MNPEFPPADQRRDHGHRARRFPPLPAPSATSRVACVPARGRPFPATGALPAETSPGLVLGRRIPAAFFRPSPVRRDVLGLRAMSRRETSRHSGGSRPSSAAPGNGAGRRPDQGHRYQELHQGRDRGIEAPAGDRRFLGAVVRALQAAWARCSRSWSRRPRARSSWSSSMSTKPAARGAVPHPIDSGGLCLQRRPAGRCLRRRAAGKPAQGTLSTA